MSPWKKSEVQQAQFLCYKKRKKKKLRIDKFKKNTGI